MLGLESTLRPRRIPRLKKAASRQNKTSSNPVGRGLTRRLPRRIREEGLLLSDMRPEPPLCTLMAVRDLLSGLWGSKEQPVRRAELTSSCTKPLRSLAWMGLARILSPLQEGGQGGRANWT